MTAIKDLLDSSGNPSEITLSYGDVVFGPLVKFHIEVVPEYDPTRRVTVYEKYRLSTVSWEHASTESSMADDMEVRRETLTQPGQRLKINQVGFGEIDTGSQTPDLAWGPHPAQAKFTMLGGGVMWQLEWSCEFRLNPCAVVSAAGGASYLSFFTYDVMYSHDELGFTTRAIRATLKVPQIQRNHKVRDIPENYRSRLSVPVPHGYKRVRFDQVSNAAQDELQFTIVDQQLRTEPFPPGIAMADVRFSISSQQALTNVILNFSISGQMETVPGFPKSLAMTRFFQIAFARLLILRRQVKGTIIPARIDMDHHPFDRRSSFNFTFQVTGADPNDIFNPKVIYQPGPMTSWNDWTSATNRQGVSLSNLWGKEGQTGLRTGSPNLIDQCNRTRGVVLGSTGREYTLGDPSFESLPSSYFTCQDVRPEHSWLASEIVVEYSRNERLAVNKRDAYLQIPFTNKQINFSSTKGPTLGSPYTSPGDTISRQGAPEQLVVIKAKQIRIKFPIEVPQYTSLEGIELTHLMQKVSPLLSPTIFGCPMYFQKWIQVYRPMAYISDKIRAMPHPHLAQRNG